MWAGVRLQIACADNLVTSEITAFLLRMFCFGLQRLQTRDHLISAAHAKRPCCSTPVRHLVPLRSSTSGWHLSSSCRPRRCCLSAAACFPGTSQSLQKSFMLVWHHIDRNRIRATWKKTTTMEWARGVKSSQGGKRRGKAEFYGGRWVPHKKEWRQHVQNVTELGSSD